MLENQINVWQLEKNEKILLLNYNVNILLYWPFKNLICLLCLIYFLIKYSIINKIKVFNISILPRKIEVLISFVNLFCLLLNFEFYIFTKSYLVVKKY